MNKQYCRVNLDEETISKLSITIIEQKLKNKSALLRAFIDDFIENPEFYKNRFGNKINALSNQIG